MRTNSLRIVEVSALRVRAGGAVVADGGARVVSGAGSLVRWLTFPT
jgi:hypothetical protein